MAILYKNVIQQIKLFKLKCPDRTFLETVIQVCSLFSVTDIQEYSPFEKNLFK